MRSVLKAKVKLYERPSPWPLARRSIYEWKDIIRVPHTREYGSIKRPIKHTDFIRHDQGCTAVYLRIVVFFINSPHACTTGRKIWSCVVLNTVFVLSPTPRVPWP